MMRWISLCAAALWLGGAALQGQQAMAPIMPPMPAPNYSQLKTYLSLTDAQGQALLDIYSVRMKAQQEIYQQISAKQMQLNALLASGTMDAAAVGQLEIDIHNLQKQLPIPASTYRDQALKVLTPDQTAKLAALVTALQLQQPALQAVTLDLVDAPPAPKPVPLAAGVSLRIESPQP